MRRDRSSRSIRGEIEASAAGNAGTSVVVGRPAATHARKPPSSTATRGVPERRRASTRAGTATQPPDVVIGHDEVVVADPGGAQRGGEVGRGGQGMAARAARARPAPCRGPEDRAREVPVVVRRAAATGLAQDPADVDDAQVGLVEACRQVLDGDEASCA